MEYLRQALDHFNKRMVKIFSYLHEIDHEYWELKLLFVGSKPMAFQAFFGL